MTTTDWKKLESTYYMQVVNRLPLVLVKGKGTIVWDEEGKKYLDFTSGWAVVNLGHSHPVVSNAIKYQVDNIMQMTNLYYTIPQLKLAKLLIDNSCFSSNSSNISACVVFPQPSIPSNVINFPLEVDSVIIFSNNNYYFTFYFF